MKIATKYPVFLSTILVSLSLFFTASNCKSAKNSSPDQENINLKATSQGTGQLILTDERLDYLRKEYATDKTLKKYVDYTINNANSLLSSELPSANNDMLWEAFNAFKLATNLGFAYKWTGDDKYAKRVQELLLTVCSFSNWNPAHFLDAGVMGIAVSLGMDWTKDYLGSGNVGIIKQALIDKILKPGITGINNNAYWTYIDNNWNIICNSGLIISALAVKDFDNSYADIIIPEVVKELSIPLVKFNPDGTWYEGVDYMRLCMDMYSYCVSGLLTYQGDDMGLLDYPGLGNAGNFFISCEGKNSAMLCYSDIYGGTTRKLSPSLFFLGKMFDNPGIIADEQEFISRKNSSDVFHIIWYEKSSVQLPSNGNKYYGGAQSFLFFDADRKDNDAIYVGMKAGQNGTSHGHLDLGNFEFDALGVRWAKDLGSDVYLDGYFDFVGDGGKRWTYYRTGSLSHNVPTINNENQFWSGKAEFTKFNLGEDPSCIINLTNAYEKYANRMYRGFKLADNRRSLIIQDEYALKASEVCSWGMTTDAQIEIADGRTAILKKNNKELIVKIVTPENCSFEVISAYQNAPQNSNNGISRLIAKKPNDGITDFTITIQLSPKWNDYSSAVEGFIPLDQWDSDVPDAPTELEVSSILPTRADLVWNSPENGTDIQGFNVYRDSQLVGTTESVNFSDNGLNPNTNYQYQVSAFNTEGNESQRTEELSVTTLPDDKMVYIIPENENRVQLNVYPNPSNGIFSLNLIGDAGAISKIEVYDINGVTVYLDKIPGRNMMDLDLQYLTNNIYVIHVDTAQHHYIGKLVINH